MHRVEALVDIREWEVMCDILVDLDTALEVVFILGFSIENRAHGMLLTFYNTRKLGATLHTTESGATPDTTCDKLESFYNTGKWTWNISDGAEHLRPGRDLFSCRCDSDDG